MTGRAALLVVHTGRPGVADRAQAFADGLVAAGFTVRVLAGESGQLQLVGAEVTPAGDAVRSAAEGVELVVALGGDGTLLRAAEAARPAGVPLLGVNFGRVGFLAEAEADALQDTVRHVVAREYVVDERLTVDVAVHRDDVLVATGWALNEVSVERAARDRMLEVMVEVDGRPLSRWGCDGVVCATPTGSTAYAFSAGGPVVWPDVEALLLVPVSAHALFARPLVTAPTSVLAVEVVAETGGALLSCDGRRVIDLLPGSRVEVRRGAQPVRVARLHPRPFTDRLVAKFALPVQGWRGPAR